MLRIIIRILAIGLPALVTGLLAGFIAFAVDPGDRFCIPVDAAQPHGACTLTLAWAGAFAIGLVPGGLIGLAGIGIFRLAASLIRRLSGRAG